MHEFSLAACLVETAGELARAHGAVRVTELACRAGAFTQIEPLTFRSAFTVVAAESLLAEARLVLDMEAFRLRCRSCGVVKECGPGQMACPLCGSQDIVLLGDHGLTITSMTLETDDEG